MFLQDRSIYSFLNSSKSPQTWLQREFIFLSRTKDAEVIAKDILILLPKCIK